MCYGHKSMQSSVGMQQLLSVILVLQIAISPLAYSNNTSSAEHTSSSPVSKYQEAYFVNDIAVNEVLNIISINRIMNKYSKDIQRLISRLQEVWMAPVVILGILLIYTATYFKVLQQRKAILATFLGGHAPPAEIISLI